MPQQNGHNESFNGRLRDELLNETRFRSLPHARCVLETWRRDYNEGRPHIQARLYDATGPSPSPIRRVRLARRQQARSAHPAGFPLASGR